jgi:hypothetical protein
MDDIFRCFVICGNSDDAWSGCQPGDDTLTYTEEWARKQREKLNKKKTTFTVLVTGMGVYSPTPEPLNACLTCHDRHIQKIPATMKMAITPKTTILLT